MTMTIKQLADQIGVSKTAVRKYMDEDFRAKYTLTDGNGTITISAPGCELIAGKFQKTQQTTENSYAATAENSVSDDIVTILRDSIDTLKLQLAEKDRQLAAKDEQIKTLNEELAKEREHSRGTADKLATLADQAQALHAGTVQQQLQAPAAPEVIIEDPDVEEARPAKKPGLFNRMFGKKE